MSNGTESFRLFVQQQQQLQHFSPNTWPGLSLLHACRNAWPNEAHSVFSGRLNSSLLLRGTLLGIHTFRDVMVCAGLFTDWPDWTLQQPTPIPKGKFCPRFSTIGQPVNQKSHITCFSNLKFSLELGVPCDSAPQAVTNFFCVRRLIWLYSWVSSFRRFERS